MDFRTEWTSWLLIVLMIVMAVMVNPYHLVEDWNFKSGSIYILQILAYPFFAITIASIPVFIICWLTKFIPDIDYSIRGGFILMLILFVGSHF
ncbi:MAG: hypothetical protein HKN09_10225 [Saprospiraceae bacterium]|nr:hypothetical protein [Saprospiraceae bacterium]